LELPSRNRSIPASATLAEQFFHRLHQVAAQAFDLMIAAVDQRLNQFLIRFPQCLGRDVLMFDGE